MPNFQQLWAIVFIFSSFFFLIFILLYFILYWGWRTFLLFILSFVLVCKRNHQFPCKEKFFFNFFFVSQFVVSATIQTMRLVWYGISVVPFISISCVQHTHILSLSLPLPLAALRRFILSSITSETWLKRIGQESYRYTHTHYYYTCNKIIERRKFWSNSLNRATSVARKPSTNRNRSTQWISYAVFLWCGTCFTFWLL